MMARHALVLLLLSSLALSAAPLEFASQPSFRYSGAVRDVGSLPDGRTIVVDGTTLILVDEKGFQLQAPVSPLFYQDTKIGNIETDASGQVWALGQVPSIAPEATGILAKFDSAFQPLVNLPYSYRENQDGRPMLWLPDGRISLDGVTFLDALGERDPAISFSMEILRDEYRHMALRQDGAIFLVGGSYWSRGDTAFHSGWRALGPTGEQLEVPYMIKLFPSISPGTPLPETGAQLLAIGRSGGQLVVRVFSETGIPVIDAKASDFPGREIALAEFAETLGELWEQPTLSFIEQQQIFHRFREASQFTPPSREFLPPPQSAAPGEDQSGWNWGFGSNIRGNWINREGDVFVYGFPANHDRPAIKLNHDGTRDLAFDPDLTGFALFHAALPSGGHLISGDMIAGGEPANLVQLSELGDLEAHWQWSGGTVFGMRHLSVTPDNAVVMVLNGELIKWPYLTDEPLPVSLEWADRRVLASEEDSEISLTLIRKGSLAETLAVEVRVNDEISGQAVGVTKNLAFASTTDRLTFSVELDTHKDEAVTPAREWRVIASLPDRKAEATVVIHDDDLPHKDGRLVQDPKFVPAEPLQAYQIEEVPIDNGYWILAKEAPRLRLLDSRGQNHPTFQSDIVPNTIAVDAESRLLAGGQFTEVNGMARPGIVRFLPTGELDASFDLGAGPEGGAVRVISPTPDGHLFVIGTWDTFDGIQAQGIVKLDSAGSVDPGFRLSGALAARAAGIQGVLPMSDGGVVIYGSFDRFGEVSFPGVARLRLDGSLDPSFGTGGLTGDVQRAKLLDDGSIVLSGVFNLANDDQDYAIIRMNGAGEVLSASLNDFRAAGSPLITSDGRIFQSDEQGILHISHTDGTPQSVATTRNGLEEVYLDSNGRLISLRFFEAFIIGNDSRVDLPEISFASPTLIAERVPTGRVRFKMNRHGDVGASVRGFMRVEEPSGEMSTSATLIARLIQFQIGQSQIEHAFDIPESPSQDRLTTFRIVIEPGDGFEVGEHGELLVGLHAPLPPSVVEPVFSRETLLPAHAVVAGPGDYRWFASDGLPGLELLGASGTAHPDFSNLGFARAEGDVLVRALARLDDGGALVGGAFDRYGNAVVSGLVFLTKSGGIHPAYDQPLLEDPVKKILPMQSGGWLVLTAGGTRSSVGSRFVHRLTPSGKLDDTFAIPTLTRDGDESSAWILDVAILSNERLVIGGGFTAVDGQERWGIAVLGRNGAVSNEILNDQVGMSFYEQLATDDFGRLYAMRAFPAQQLSRCLPDLTRDITFAPLSDIDEWTLSGNRLYVNRNGSGIYRLWNDGSVELRVAGDVDFRGDWSSASITEVERGKFLLTGPYQTLDGIENSGLIEVTTGRPPTPYEIWLHALGPEAADLVNFPDLDSDRDGFTNFEEAIFGSHPLEITDRPASWQISQDGWTRSLNPLLQPFGVFYDVSDDLSNWRLIPSSSQGATGDGAFIRVRTLAAP